ncbi:MAG: DUF2726 domain-containing protein [Nitrospiraceae bacterium]
MNAFLQQLGVPLWAVATAIVLLIGLMIVLLQRRRTEPSASTSDERVAWGGVSVAPQALVSPAALSLYNLIKFAVEDRYLVCVHVPVWSLVTVQTEDPAVRRALLRKVALRRVDMALLHPGTRLVEQVIILDGEPGPTDARRRHSEVAERLLREAGIVVTHLNAAGSYSISELQKVLGLEPPED